MGYRVVCLGLLFFSVLSADSEKKGQLIFESSCASCHGLQGQGNLELLSPPLAGLPKWYMEYQLESFRMGYRGGKPKDPSALMMKQAISTLNKDKVSLALTFLQEQPVLKTEPRLKGDAERGKGLFTQHCSQCHRYNASGEKVFKSAPLILFPDWYLLEQYRKFKDGRRGWHSGDVLGLKMVDALYDIKEEKDFIDILAYLNQMKARAIP